MTDIHEDQIRTRMMFNAVNLHTLIAAENSVPNMELIRASAALNRRENVLCVKRQHINPILNGINYSDYTNRFDLYSVPRSVAEFMGDWIQVVAGICLHTETACLFLRLNEAHPFVSSYNVGTTTFPMGHVRLDTPIEDVPCRVITGKAREGAIRELFEEVHFPWMGTESDTEGDSRDHETERSTLVNLIEGAGAYAYYSNTGISNSRHIGIIFDVDVSSSLELSRYFKDDNHELKSGEPQKHTVSIMDYEKLIRELPSTDYLGAYETMHMQSAKWWNRTFLGHTFIRNDIYQNKTTTDVESTETPSGQ